MRKHKRNHELLIFINLNYDFLDVFYKITAQRSILESFSVNLNIHVRAVSEIQPSPSPRIFMSLSMST